MNQKALILSIPMILAALLLGGWLLLCEPKSAPESQNPPVVGESSPKNAGNLQPPTNLDTPSVDTSQWKTYRNEKYGFELKYPEDAEVETFYSNGIGSPIDCKKTPEKCLNFSIKVQNKKGETLITMETFSKELPVKNDINKENSESLAFHRGGKTVFGNNYTKSNSYFPMFSSCFTVVNFSDANLRKNGRFHFFKFYEIQEEISSGDAEMSCAKENKDAIFDEIIGSFRLF